MELMRIWQNYWIYIGIFFLIEVPDVFEEAYIAALNRVLKWSEAMAWNLCQTKVAKELLILAQEHFQN